MKETGERFKKFRVFINKTQKMMGDSLGITQQSVAIIEKTGQLAKETIEEFLNEYGLETLNWVLYNRGKDPTEPNKMTDVYSSIPEGKVPVIGWKQVVRWINSEKEAIKDQSWEFVYSPEPTNKQLFALKIESEVMAGDSEDFKVGGIIFVDPTNIEPLQGDYVIAIKRNSAEAVLRQYLFDAGEPFLRPLHNQFPIEKVGETYAILGVVLTYQKDIKK